MAWIESHQELRNHPKTRKAARLADTTRRDIIGALHFLWWWALDYAPDGNLTLFDPEEIEAELEWQGRPGQLMAALTDCGQGDGPGFLERTIEGELLIHDWWDYAGKLVAERQADRERKRARRQAVVQRSRSGRPVDVRRTSSGIPEDGDRTADVHNSTQHNTTNTTEMTANLPAIADPEPISALRADPPLADPEIVEPKTPILVVNGKGEPAALPAPKLPKPPSPHFQLVEALAEVCAWDLAANKGRLLAEAKLLAAATPKPTPELIRQNYGEGEDVWWWKCDWRGRDGENPAPATIRETWGKWLRPEKAADRKSKGGKSNGFGLTSIQDTGKRARQPTEAERAAVEKFYAQRTGGTPPA